jgi:hypothetical protein
LGNKTFHYLNAGLAFMTVDQPEKRSIIDRYQNGLVVDPLSPHTIAARLYELSRTPDRLSEMKSNSRRAAEQLAWENDKQKYVGIYINLFEKALFADDFSLGNLGKAFNGFPRLRGLGYLLITLNTY